MASYFKIAAITILACIALPTAAMADWKVSKLTGPGSVKSSAKMHPAVTCSANTCFRNKTRPFFFEGKDAPNGLPDGKIAASRRYKDIRQAWYILPTRRYDHGILGDAIEAGGLAVKTAKGKVLTFKLPDNQVFEDRIPRLADLDGDGRAEIITILSSLQKGASIAVFSISKGNLVERTRTPFIGRSYRWLNIAGIADFNADGRLDIAGVWTPHIGGTLKFWTLTKGKLRKIGSMQGFSNHFIGSREQRISAIGDVDGNGTLDIVLPSARRDRLRMVGFKKNHLGELASLSLPRKIDKAIAINGKGRKTVITLGLSDHSTVAVHQ